MNNVIPFPITRRKPEDLETRSRNALADLLVVAANAGITGFAIAFQKRDGTRRALLAGICEDNPTISIELTERMLDRI
ncbi:MAG: hypothetical protein KDA51_06635 [Planctomycetales bacterium]|nr:hypothetical protein [Planctomycetales bacterium]